jgi:hypothetical protein
MPRFGTAKRDAGDPKSLTAGPSMVPPTTFGSTRPFTADSRVRSTPNITFGHAPQVNSGMRPPFVDAAGFFKALPCHPSPASGGFLTLLYSASPHRCVSVGSVRTPLFFLARHGQFTELVPSTLSPMWILQFPSPSRGTGTPGPDYSVEGSLGRQLASYRPSSPTVKCVQARPVFFNERG